MATVTYVDGLQVQPDQPTIRPDDPGLFGIGVYEALRTYGGEPFAVSRHLERLADGAEALGIEADVEAIARDVALANRACLALGVTGEQTLRVLLTGGGRRIVEAGPLVIKPPVARAVTLPWRRAPDGPLSGVKASSTAAVRVARRYVEEAEVDDGLWLTTEGMVSEALAANVFAVLGGRLVTPPLADGALPGVTRSLLLEMGAEERSFPAAALIAADEAFLAATSNPAQPLVEVNGRPLGDGTPGPVAQRVAERFSAQAAALLTQS